MEKYFNMLKIKNYNIIGSYSDPSRKFYGDIDLEEVLDDMSIPKFISNLQKIIRAIKTRDDMFFLDFKAGNRNGQPIKWKQNEILEGYRYIDNKKITLSSALQDKAIVKLDVVVLTNKFMIPITINYWLYDRIVDTETFKSNVYYYAQYLKDKGDVIDYIKKMVLYYSLEKDQNKVDKLNKILNSDFGVVYKYIGFLENILLLLQSDNTGYTLDNVRNNFRKIYDDLPVGVKHLILPLLHIVNKMDLIKTIPKIIHSLDEYIRLNVKIDRL